MRVGTELHAAIQGRLAGSDRRLLAILRSVMDSRTPRETVRPPPPGLVLGHKRRHDGHGRRTPGPEYPIRAVTGRRVDTNPQAWAKGRFWPVVPVIERSHMAQGCPSRAHISRCTDGCAEEIHS